MRKPPAWLNEVKPPHDFTIRPDPNFKGSAIMVPVDGMEPVDGAYPPDLSDAEEQERLTRERLRRQSVEYRRQMEQVKRAMSDLGGAAREASEKINAYSDVFASLEVSSATLAYEFNKSALLAPGDTMSVTYRPELFTA